MFMLVLCFSLFYIFQEAAKYGERKEKRRDSATVFDENNVIKPMMKVMMVAQNIEKRERERKRSNSEKESEKDVKKRTKKKSESRRD